MRFIENNELREWVKDNLRKTIFQKAHSLAVQTGCEVLVKLQDVTDAAGCQYYATTTLQQAYKMSNLRQPGEMAVSGETGMPTFPMVDRAIQSGDDSTTGYASSLAADSEGGDGDDGQGELNGLGQGGIVPMQLSMTGAGDQGTDQRTHMSTQRSDSEHSSHPSTPATSMGLPMQVKTEPGSDLMDLIGLIPGSGDGSTPNIKQEPPGDDKSSDGTVSYGDNDDIIDVTPAQQAAQQAQAQAQQAAQQMQMMFQQQQQAAAAAAQGMGSPPTSPYGAAAQLQAFSQSNVPAAQGSPGSGMSQQRYPVPMAPKPYQCATCQKAFGSIQLLQKHTQTFHMRAQNVMAQKSRGRGRGARGGGSRGGSSQRMNWSPSQSPQRFQQPGQGDMTQQQWLQQVSAASGSPSQAQLAQAQALGQGGTSPSSSQYGQHSPSAFPSPGAGPSRASPQARRQLIGSSPSRGKSSTTTRHRHSLGKRFALATARGIMSGLLLTPGPVSTHKALKNLSMAFNVAVTKTKFISACNRLQAANLGFLVEVSNKNRQAQVFVKRPPEEVQMIIESSENSDLTTFLEYSQRFALPPSAAVTPPIKEKLVQMGMVRPEHFKDKPGAAVQPAAIKSEVPDMGSMYGTLKKSSRARPCNWTME